MNVDVEAAKQFTEQGFLVSEPLFTEAELTALRDETDREFDRPGPQRTLEEDTGRVRAVHGVHRTNEFFGRLIRDSRLLAPAMALLDEDVYVHQFKINAKHGLGGGIWEWHQDYSFWRREDGMPEPRALSAAVFLDPVDEFNGPLYVVPGSHDQELLVHGEQESDWESTLSASLKYRIDEQALADCIGPRGIVAPHGPAGTVLFFDARLLHGSPPNMSPFGRRLLIVTYNAVSNAPREDHQTRPEFLAGRDTEALQAVGEGAALCP
ncbi:phytanoyl-CoA dioxygenase family protein [Streptomyces sp. NPDC052301]|uniref:phytanoyl-CoA dioxygenase family protein n=1 Tax=Streptomyces sp. NPDC052301 TaxID=3365687 RepID=UPI0037CE297D